MNRTEKFISEHTRNCSNQYDLPEYFENGIERLKEYQPWLTPDQARKAVEIAREEIYEWLRMNFCNYFDDTGETFDKCIDDLKQAMKDE
jgi:hypothetical protein